MFEIELQDYVLLGKPSKFWVEVNQGYHLVFISTLI